MAAGGLARGLAVALAVALALALGAAKWRGLDRDAVMGPLGSLPERLGPWAMPLYALFHAVAVAFCLPYAVFLEAAAPALFGFLPAVLCVASAKVLGASLSFSIGRAIFRCSKSAMAWAKGSKYFNLIARGVERDGWKFVLLARFSPLPSYVINYALAATEVGFLLDFLLPTVIGCLPMILQNTSIGSLAGAAVSSTTGSKKMGLSSYFFPLLGIASSILISLKIKKYSSEMSVATEHHRSSTTNGSVDAHCAPGESSTPISVDKSRKQD